MTRVNLVPVQELYDQHLFAEWRELKMIPKSLARSLQARGLDGVVKMVPPAFTLNKGHVSFFYDKGCFLFDRFQQLRQELILREYDFNRSSELDPDDVYLRHPRLLGSSPPWQPSECDIEVSRERIEQRVALQPSWYRYTRPAWARPAGLHVNGHNV